MAEPFLSEIRIMSFVFAPKGWALCNGQLLPINQNQALFSLLGTTYGGDGRVNFGLPDLRARTPIHVGSGHTLGERGGEDAHTITLSEMPQHTHFVAASSVFSGGNNSPTGRFLGGAADAYAAPTDPSKFTTLRPGTITNTGGSQAHNNDQPYLVLSFCIALQGIFPSPN
jgi:microcystin-dependent protein